MKFKAIFRYELWYRCRAPSTWIYAALMYLGPLLIVHTSSTANNRVINAPAHYAEIVVLLGFFLMVVTAAIFGDAATRDAETGMQSLFNTAPISKFDYLGGRFAAAFLVNWVLLLGMPLMVALSTQLPWLAHFNWAPFRWMSFIQPLVLLTTPNLLISAAIIFTVATLTKNTLATYLGALTLAILYLIVVNQGLGNDTLEIMVDPFGVGALQKVTRYWTPVEQTTRLIGFHKYLLWNRLLWVGIGALLLAVLYRKFDFVAPGLRGRRRSVRTAARADEPVRHAVVMAREVRRVFDARTRRAQLAAIVRHELRGITRNWLFLLICAAAVFLAFSFGWEVGAIVFDTSTWPVTHLVAGDALTMPMEPLFVVLISLIAGELVWRERDVGMGDIGAAGPVPDWIPIAARFIALAAILAVLQLVLMASGIALQTVQGYYHFEPLLYLEILGLNLVEYLIFAAMAMAVHVVVNQKAMGHTIVVAVFLYTLVGPRLLQIHHNLLLFGSDPGWVYSDLNGFGPFMTAVFWFKTYWAAWALLFGVVATVFWVRGSETGLRARTRLAWLRLAGPAGRAAIVALALIATLGGFVFYHTNILNDYRSQEEGIALRVAYEKQYKRYENAPQPTIVRDSVRAEIYPERQQAEVSGTFTLVNLTARAIDTVHLSMTSAVHLISLSFEGGARLALDDSTLNYRMYVLQQPIAPGDTQQMTFAVRFDPRGFSNWRSPTAVVRNGAYFDRSWLPLFGYQPSREFGDDRRRPKYGLGPQKPAPSPRDTTAEVRDAITRWNGNEVETDVTIGTSADQIAVTPGQLVREWRENGRHYFRYVTDGKVIHGVPVLSARYAVRDSDWKGLPLRVYYHPTHTFNVERMLRAMYASLDYYSTAFGPYPFPELRVVEFPRYASFARANPYTITFSEGSAFITRIQGEDVDRPFFVVAHETAHQWWGNALRSARLKGAALLSETLAQYSAMMVMEKTYGLDMARRFYGFERDRYLRGRSAYASREVPLVDALDEGNLYYNKGAVAMYTMREMLGADAVNTALRRFYATYAGKGAPYPTSLDLMRELRAVTPDSLQYLIADLFETITLWDVETDSGKVARNGSEWRVTLTVTARKLQADSIGKESEVPMNDLVEIGVFGPPSNCRCGNQLYLARHRIRSGTQTISFVMPFVPGAPLPVYARADPWDRLIQREWRPGVALTASKP